MTDTAEKLAEALAQIVLIEADSTTIAADKIRGAARIARAALDANRADRAKGAVTDEMAEAVLRVYEAETDLIHHSEDPAEATIRCMRAALSSLPMLGVPNGLVQLNACELRWLIEAHDHDETQKDGCDVDASWNRDRRRQLQALLDVAAPNPEVSNG